MAGAAEEGAREQEFHRLLSEQHNMLIGLAQRRWYGDQQRARDLVQDVFERAMKARPDPLPRVLGAWLCRILERRFIDEWRQKRRTERYISHGPFEEDRLAVPIPDDGEPFWSKIPPEALLDAIETLPRKLREVVELHYFEHMKQRDIANKLRRPEKTVAVQLFRARNRLFDILIARFPPDEGGLR